MADWILCLSGFVVILGEFGGDWGFFCDFLDFFADFLLVACGGLSFFILLLWLGLLYQLF